MTAMIIDHNTATILCAEYCNYVPDSALTEAEWDELESASDSTISAYAKERGRPILADVSALDTIAALLNGKEWNADTLDSIAHLIRGTGRTVEDMQ